jgi:tetratricopeptide (TPR) repeat protein
MIKLNSHVSLEEKTQFSESRLWAVQRSFYDNAGIEAWTSEVPFYVTSNPIIAHNYARIVVSFICDWISNHPEAISHPFYFVELGAGTGQFSYYTLSIIVDMIQSCPYPELNFCYIVTDFTEKNIDFWKSQSVLEQFINDGVLDFALFDIEQDSSLHLMLSSVTLAKDTVENPITVFANYLFDSIVVDVFKAENGKLFESLVNINIEQKYAKSGQVQWDKAKLSYVENQVDPNYYDEAIFNDILTDYANNMESGSFCFPLAGLRGLAKLADIASGRLLLLSSDKGYVDLSELEDLDPPEVAFHGSFSLMVNYHAIAQFFLKNKGAVFLQEPFDAFATCAFSLGFDLALMPSVRHSLRETIEYFCPGHFFHLYDHFENTIEKANLETIASMLNYTHWDPAIFALAGDRISELMDGADLDVVAYLARNMYRIRENFYFVPGVEDILFNIGVFFYELEEYDQAIEYFQESSNYFDDSYELFYNLADCYFELSDCQQARFYIDKAATFNPKSKDFKILARKIKSIT